MLAIWLARLRRIHSYFIGAVSLGRGGVFSTNAAGQATVFCHTSVWIVEDLSPIYDNLYSKEGIPLKLNSTQILYTAIEGPVRIQCKYLVPIYVLPEIKLGVLVISKIEL